ncbi:hypothetical protein RIF29_20223 [Crotalaria pallida]|uniref:Protein FAR1-RELATED SEQUENCE n=1 Tax=Crotalaria pallida TaxID=3830 RepID=A0AAN9I652_CROPI
MSGEGGPTMNVDDPARASTKHEYVGQSNNPDVEVEHINGDAYYFDKLDLGSITEAEIRKLWFVDNEVAFEFYRRGEFYAGLTTTSRCEGLHAQVGRYVESGYSLIEFIHHFQRCLSYIHWVEVCADHNSQMASFICPERRDNEMLLQKDGIEWYSVLFVKVAVFLHMGELPSYLVSKRWTKKAKEHSVTRNQLGAAFGHDTLFSSRYGALSDICRLWCNLAAMSESDFKELRQKALIDCQRLEAKHRAEDENGDAPRFHGEDANVRDPIRVRTKERVKHCASRPRTAKKPFKCSSCRGEGHSKNHCPYMEDV